MTPLVAGAVGCLIGFAIGHALGLGGRLLSQSARALEEQRRKQIIERVNLVASESVEEAALDDLVEDVHAAFMAAEEPGPIGEMMHAVQLLRLQNKQLKQATLGLKRMLTESRRELDAYLRAHHESAFGTDADPNSAPPES